MIIVKKNLRLTYIF